MPKDKSKESTAPKIKVPAPSGSGSGLNRVHLFLLVLVCSIGFNLYIRWNKSPEEDSLQPGASSAKVAALEKELKESKELLALIKKDQVELDKMFSLSKIVSVAQKSKPVIRFSTNETKAEKIAEVAAAVPHKVFHSCDSKNIPVGEMDDYKNCFRDLAIELHNRLEMIYPQSHFFVSAGRINYSFMVTTMHSKRQEYFITVGEILFELLEYDDLLTNVVTQEDEVTAEPEIVFAGDPKADQKEMEKPKVVEAVAKGEKAKAEKPKEEKPKAEKPKEEKPKAEKPKAEKPKAQEKPKV